MRNTVTNLQCFINAFNKCAGLSSFWTDFGRLSFISFLLESYNLKAGTQVGLDAWATGIYEGIMIFLSKADIKLALIVSLLVA